MIDYPDAPNLIKRLFIIEELAMLNNSQALIMTKDNEIIYNKDKIDLNGVDLLPDKILVKVLYTPINPMDYYFCCHIRNKDKPLPCIPGFESYGEVIGVGDPKDQNMVGKRVLVIPLYGTYCSYIVVDRKEIVCIGIEDPQVKKYFAVNPLTAMGLMELITVNNARCIIQTGASTQVGKMVISMARERGICTINIVRNDKYKEVLENLGADYVINSNDPNFIYSLNRLCDQLKPTMAFDCIGGELVSVVFKNLAYKGTLIVYGLLSLMPVINIDCNEINAKEKRIEGFHVFHSFWKNKSPKEIDKMLKNFYARGFDGEDSVSYFKPENFKQALEQWPNRTSKFIIKF